MGPRSTLGARLHRAALAAATLAALASCAAIETKETVLAEANAVRQGPEQAPFRSITNFGHALRCMDNLLVTYGVRDVSMLVEELADTTKKVNAGTRDMLISAMSDMTRRSRALRLVAFGQDSGNVISFLAQAERKSAYAVVPQFDIKGSISQFDESIARKEASAGGSWGEYFNFGIARSGSVTILGVDLTVLNTNDLSVVPGVTSRNAVMIQRSGRGFDGDAQYRKFGVNFTSALGKAEGNSQALRNLIELAAIELVGKLVKIPYWSCLGADPDSEAVKTEIGDWYFAMTGDVAELITWFQQQLTVRGYYRGPIDGEGNDALGEAIQRYRTALKLQPSTRIDQAFFAAYLNADHAAIERADPDRKPSVAKLPEQPASGAAAPQSANATASAPAAAATQAAAPAQFAAARPAPIRVAIASQKGERAVFRRGELLSLSIRPDRDAYVYCFLRDDSNNVQRFFPNRFARDALVRANQGVEVPGRAKFELHASERGITETVACFAAPQEVFAKLPERVRAPDFESLSKVSLEELRAVFAQAAGAELGSATFNIEVR